MASQPSAQKTSSRWGSFLANVESKLDTILADEDTAPKPAGKGDGKTQEQPTKKETTSIPTSATPTSQSRPSSTNRAQDRLNEKLARAMANRNANKKADGSITPSTVPSRTASPANAFETPRSSADVQRGEEKEVPSPEKETVAADDQPAPSGAIVAQDVPKVVEPEATRPNGIISGEMDEALQGSDKPRDSIDVQSRSSPRLSAESSRSFVPSLSDAPNADLQNEEVPGKPSDEYQSTISQLQSDNEAAELRRQAEVHDYMERIDALQAKLQYLTKEATEAAKLNASDAARGSPEQKLAEKDEKIALLIEEGQKLSQTELKHMSIIKKLRAKAAEDDKTLNDAKLSSSKFQKLGNDAQERAKRAEASEKQALEQSKGLPRLEKELETLRYDKESNDDLVRDLQVQLSEATSNAKQAEEKERIEALEVERQRAAQLSDDLSNLKIEKELSEKSLNNALRELKEKSEREKERARVAEIERQAERDALESKLEAYRARVEEASAGHGGDVQAKLLRQVETLQNQYAVASENWQGIEGSLLSRVGALEKERDEIAKRESETRRKARESNTKSRKLEEDLERINIRASDLDGDLLSRASQVSNLQERLSKAEADLNRARDEFRAERDAWEAQQKILIDEEKTRTRDEVLRANHEALFQQFRNESPVLRTRKSSNGGGHVSPGQSRRQQGFQAASNLSLTIGNGSIAMDRSTSRHSSEKRKTSAGFPPTEYTHPFGLTSSRPESMSVMSPQNGVIPETPSIKSPHDSKAVTEDGYFDDIANPATPDRTINDVISASTTAAGPSVQLVERMSAAVRRLESEKAAHRDELTRLSGQRDEAREQLVDLMKDNEEKKASDGRVTALEKELTEVKERYLTTLEMLGEKSERVEELKADVVDLKGMYRELVERTTG